MMLKTNVKAAPAGFLADLTIGTLVKDVRTQMHGEVIIWQIADINHPGYPQNSVTLISHRALFYTSSDAREPENPQTKCTTYGNGLFAKSNLRQWLNSEGKANEWFTPQHEFDTPPSREYTSGGYNPTVDKPGFLYNFSPIFRQKMIPTTLNIIIPDAYGGGFESITDRLFLPSMSELNYSNTQKIPEGTAYPIFTNAASRYVYLTQGAINILESKTNVTTNTKVTWWTRTCNGGDVMYNEVIATIGAGTYDYCSSHNGVRPVCNLPARTRVSPDADENGVYSLFV